MRKFILSSLIIGLILCFTSPQEALGISYQKRVLLRSDTVWEGEVEVHAGIFVPRGITLTLAPGCKITFIKGKQVNKFEVRGRLIARGTAERPVVLTSNVVRVGSWPGILFFIEGERTPDTPANQLSHVMIKYAKTAVTLERGDVVFDGCTFEKNKVGLEVAVDSVARVTNSIFDNIKQTAIKVERGSELELQHSTIRFCQDGVVGGGDYRLVVKDNTFQHNERAVFLSSTNPNNLISNNRFIENHYAVKIERRTRIQLTNNRFKANAYGIHLANQSNSQIKNNFFSGNQQAITCIRMSDPLIQQNEMTGNKIAIACFLGSYPKINYNNIYENQTAIFLRFISADWDLQAGISPALTVFDATQNWWGEKMTGTLQARGDDFNRPDIFDGYDAPYNQDRGRIFLKQKVNFANWLEKKVEITGLSPVQPAGD